MLEDDPTLTMTKIKKKLKDLNIWASTSQINHDLKLYKPKQIKSKRTAPIVEPERIEPFNNRS
jgi:hypothetical protein